MIAGQLELQLFASIARLQQDMDAAKRTVDSSMAGIKGAANSARTALESLGIGMSIIGFAEFIKSSIESVDVLHDMALKAQMSVEALSGLKEIARTSGTSLDDVVNASDKMAKSLAGGGAAATQATQAIGLNIAKLRSEKPEQAMLDIATAMNKFADGQGKAAVAQALFGRSGAQLMAFLKDLADAGKINATMTQEQADKADELADRIDKLGRHMDLFKQSVALAVLPTIGALLSAFTDVDKQAAMIEQNKHAVNFAEATGKSLAITYDILRSFGDAAVLVGKSTAQAFHDIYIGAQMAGAWLNPFKKSSEEIPKLMAERQAFAKAWQDDMAATVTGSTAGFNALDAFNKKLIEINSPAAKAARGEGKDKPALNFSVNEGKITEYQKVTSEILKFNAAQKLELDGADKVTAGQTLAINILDKIRDGTLKLTEAQKIYIAALLNDALATEQLNIKEQEHEKRAHEVSQQAIKDYEEQQKAILAYENEWDNYIGGIEKSNRSLQDQIDFFGLTATQIEAVKVKRIEDLIVLEEANNVLPEYVDRTKQLLEVQKESMDKTKILEAKQEWLSMWQSIDTAAHDAWMHIGDQGNNVLKSLGLAISNIGKELAYLTLKKWIINVVAPGLGMNDVVGGTSAAGGISGWLSGLFGGGNAAPGIQAGGIDFAASSPGVDLSSFGSNFLGSFAAGLDNVPHDGLAYVHEGEKITPKAQNNSSSGITMHYTFAPNIDSRTDRAEVYSDMKKLSDASAAEMVDRLKRDGKIP